MVPAVIDEAHIIHTGRTCGHAGQTAQTTIDMLYRLWIRGTTILQHIFHQVDATARAVQLVAEKDISRACREAEPTMDACAHHFFGFREIGISE